MSLRSTTGFERPPRGQLLTQFVDLDHPLGAAYERSVGYAKDFHTHDRLNLSFPRTASVIRFTTRGPRGTFTVDGTRFLWMPPEVVHRQDTESVIYDNLALFPDAGTVAEARRRFERKYGKTVRLPERTVAGRRTPWLDALVHQYFAERIVERRRAADLEGLVHGILEELLRILHCPRCRIPAGAPPAEGPEVVRALRYIEANLFGDMDTKAIARFARVSAPTLFRKFRAETGLAEA